MKQPSQDARSLCWRGFVEAMSEGVLGGMALLGSGSGIRRMVLFETGA